MKIDELIKQLQRIRKRSENLEVRLGEHGGGSSQIDGVYKDEDEHIVIY